MKKILAVILLSALGLPTLAQGACPVVVTTIDPKAPMLNSYNYYSGIGDVDSDPWGLHLHLAYTNMSGKTIVGIRFGVSFSDIMTNAISSSTDYVDNDVLKPRKRGKGSWDDGLYTNSLGPSARAEVHLLRVAFADGTAWTTGDETCAWANGPDRSPAALAAQK